MYTHILFFLITFSNACSDAEKVGCVASFAACGGLCACDLPVCECCPLCAACLIASSATCCQCMFPNWKECNDQPNPCHVGYNLSKNINVQCCGNVPYDTSTTQCCGGKTFDITKEACCGDQIYNPFLLSCCKNMVYNPNFEKCCRNDFKYTYAICTKEKECCQDSCINKTDACCIYALDNNWNNNKYVKCPGQTDTFHPCCGTYNNPVCLKPGEQCCVSEHPVLKKFACSGPCCQKNVRTLEKVCCPGGCQGSNGLYCEKD